MVWWGWLIVGMVIAAILFVLTAIAQKRRRKGLVVGQDSGSGPPPAEADLSLPGILVRASELTGWPVVSLAGEKVAEIKDVVFDRASGQVNGFTLRSPGLFSRRRRDALAWQAVHGLGRDAVMIAAPQALIPAGKLVGRRELKRGNVLRNQVLTDLGVDVGSVVDVVLQVGRGAHVVGYEVHASPALPARGQKVYIPLPTTLMVSGERLIVPAAATEFIVNDLTGFGAAVEAFRSRLTGQQG